MAHYAEVYVQFWFCFKVWLKQNFFDMEDFNCNYDLIYTTFFHWLLQFLPLATIKYKSNKRIIQLFIFAFAPNLPQYPCNYIREIHRVWVSRENKQFDFADLNLPQKMDLGLEFQKTNVKIKISIFKIEVWNFRKLMSE